MTKKPTETKKTESFVQHVVRCLRSPHEQMLHAPCSRLRDAMDVTLLLFDMLRLQCSDAVSHVQSVYSGSRDQVKRTI